MRGVKQFLHSLSIALILFSFACSSTSPTVTPAGDKYNKTADNIDPWKKKDLSKSANPVLQKVIDYGIEQTTLTTTYDPAYVSLDYPNGDLPIEKGVCTDVVIRAFRKGNVDLQQAVHEDMVANFSVYPKKWGMKATDKNIDHRRVPNLQTYFTRKGKSLPITEEAGDYKPGDLVTWDLDGNGLAHIGLVTNIWSETSKRYIIVHNIGAGARLEDRLFDWKVTGHYRYF